VHFSFKHDSKIPNILFEATSLANVMLSEGSAGEYFSSVKILCFHTSLSLSFLHDSNL